MFRERSGAFGDVPEADRIDKWLFLMQHFGAPTRLLDWTESPLIALFFALDSYRGRTPDEKYQSRPCVWALHPLILNLVAGVDGFPNTWTRRDGLAPGGRLANFNPGVEYFRLAFHPESEWADQINLDIVKLAIAVQTSYVDLRMYSQRSCFTIHGTGGHDIETIYANGDYLRQEYLYKYEVQMNAVDSMYEDLGRLGITRALVFPDFEGLASELEYRSRN
jgi:hypothetical protein